MRIDPQCTWQAMTSAFDVARPKHIARIMEDHDAQGGIIAVLLREMAGLEGQAAFECVESRFSFARCIRRGSVAAPRLWLEMAMQILANMEQARARKRMGVILDLDGKNLPDMQFYVC